MQVNKESIINLSTNILNLRNFILQKKKNQLTLKLTIESVHIKQRKIKDQKNMNRALVICESASNGLTHM